MGHSEQQSSKPIEEISRVFNVLNMDVEDGEIAGGNWSGNEDQMEGSKVGSPTEIAPTHASSQAGASSRTRSSNFACTDKKLVFFSPKSNEPIVLPKPQTSSNTSEIEKTRWRNLKANCLHYRWKVGPRTGTIVVKDQAPKVLRSEHYKSRCQEGVYWLAPVFGSPFVVEQGQSQVNAEIQSVLGEIKINEFGSHM
jgi:hypothetical protein